MKKILAFFNELIEKGELSVSPFTYLGRNKKRIMMRESYASPVFLLQDEFLKVRDADVPESLQKIKDAFVLQCVFGCRISEFKRLTMDNIDVTDDGIIFVHYLPEKTLRENIGRDVKRYGPPATKGENMYTILNFLQKYLKMNLSNR